MKYDIPDTRPFLTDASAELYLRILDGQGPIPPSAALNALLSSALVTPDPANPGSGYYQALDVDAAVLEWQTNLQIMSGRLLAESQSVPEQLRELGRAFRRRHPSPDTGIEYVQGTEVINQRLAKLVSGCATELLTAQPTGPRAAHVLVMSYERDLSVLQRGAQMRTIYLPTARQDAPTARWAATMTEHGAQIRTSWDIGRVIIIDRRTAVTPAISRDGDGHLAIDRALFIADESVVQLLVAGFERDWARAESWDGTQSQAKVTAEQRQILIATAQGLEQEQVAEKLKIARRTVAKRMAELREVAGVENLAQLMYWWAKNENQV